MLRRAPILDALAEHGPQDRAALEQRLSISRSTSHRLTRSLLQLGLIRARDGHFSLTATGAAVAEEAGRFRSEVGHALALAPIHEVAQALGEPMPKDALEAAVVTPANRGDGFQPVRRFLELIADTRTLRGIDIVAVAPLYLDEAIGRIFDGMKTEEIAVPDAVEDVLRGSPERCHEACATGNLKMMIHEPLPCALLLTDDRVAIGARQSGSRRLDLLVDTGAESAMRWAESAYGRYRAHAVPLAQFSFPCFQEAMVTLRSRRR